jgi:uncharacterized membrane protein
MQGSAPLAAAALAWIAIHIGLAGTALRGLVAGRLGERWFRVVFSLLSVASIWALVAAYNAAPTAPLWFAPQGLRWLLVVLMLPASMLLVAAFTVRNPTGVGGEAAMRQEPRAMLRVTRHPMLWSFALWAGVHIAGNGDTASLLFFGAFLVTALAGMPSIDAKLARRDPEGWAALAGRTSVLPFAAIAAGRNRLAPAEIGWVPVLLGAALWTVLLAFHRTIFGVAPVAPLG